VRNQCRPKIYTHDEGFYYYFLSFRCCAEADRKQTDPRTPKQRKANWKFEKVEQIATFTRQDVQKALKNKTERGSCGCKPRDARCNTLCGTLLGPEAHDYPKSHARGGETKSHPTRDSHDEPKTAPHATEERTNTPTSAPVVGAPQTK
jgi:hypothetical protein